MKKFIIYFILAVVVTASIWGIYTYFMCESCGLKTKAHFYLIDTSEEQTINFPDPVGIADNFYGPNENIFNGAFFKVKTLSSNNYAQGHELHLIQTTPLVSNEIERIAQLNVFFEDISTSIELLLNESNGSSYSSLIYPIMQTLEELKGVEADEKVLHVYSDLIESTEDTDLNLYEPKVLSELFLDPSKMRAKIEEKFEIPTDLDGITLHFVYSSKNYEDIRTFEAMAEILKYLLEEKGATVHIHSLIKEEGK